MDRIFWIVLSRLWKNWRSSLQAVRPDVTEHPTAEWTARQLLEACALEEGPRYLIRDRDKSMATAINVSASHCSSRRTSTGSLEDAVRRSRRRGPGIHVESSRADRTNKWKA